MITRTAKTTPITIPVIAPALNRCVVEDAALTAGAVGIGGGTEDEGVCIGEALELDDAFWLRPTDDVVC